MVDESWKEYALFGRTVKYGEEASLADELGWLKLTDAEPTATCGLFVGRGDLEATTTGCKWWFVGKMKAGAGCVKREKWFYCGERATEHFCSFNKYHIKYKFVTRWKAKEVHTILLDAGGGWGFLCLVEAKWPHSKAFSLGAEICSVILSCAWEFKLIIGELPCKDGFPAAGLKSPPFRYTEHLFGVETWFVLTKCWCSWMFRAMKKCVAHLFGLGWEAENGAPCIC